MPTSELMAGLRREGIRDVADSVMQRALYSSDASLYRVVPTAVVRPRHTDEVAATLAVCRAVGVPVTCRGAGTSIAGNAVGTGVVIDFQRHLNRITDLDPGAGTATVEPGVVQARLQRAAAPHGLRFGPDPSTHDRCTIGGMIGNNACGSRSLAYGRTADNVLALDVLTAGGRRLYLDGSDPDDDGAELSALRRLVAGELATIRTELGRFGRQGSGYALEHLLPEQGFDVRRALVGSEGTLAVVLGATLRLVPAPRHTALVVLGYPDMATAADAAPAVLPHRPTACEGLDSRLVAAVRDRRGRAAVPALPRGGGWLFVEVAGESQAEAAAAAERVAATASALESLIVTDPRHTAALWRIREDGAGLAGRTPAGAPAYSGWEDSAVPPGHLGRYLRELDELLAEHKLTGLPYGHFGDGCVHLRLDFPLREAAGKAALRAFMLDAGRLVTRYGGSLSGEHGDGRARGELLPLMYPPAVLSLFGQVKTVFDADNRLNPGVLVRPRPLDADLRVVGIESVRKPLRFAYPDDDGDFTTAVHRCTGVGRCLADSTRSGRVMCPSYLATGEEKDTTRGRARILQEAINGSLVKGGWRAKELHSALDLCLACKACSADCPAGVDMATYKSEALFQAYRGRTRPRSHYTLGRLPRWARLASLSPRLANAALASPGIRRAARKLSGMDARRGMPRFATTTFRRWWRRTRKDRRREGPAVLLWVDTFTRHFSPDVAISAVQVLEEAGFRVALPRRTTCCAITWITTGQLTKARRILGRTVSVLHRAVEDGMLIVGLEPSCTATLRSDAVNLLDSDRARAVAGAVRTLGQVLATATDWQPRRLDGVRAVAQPHCHHNSVFGWEADEALLRRVGVELTRLGGCCGLAGNFGVERGHYEVSVAVAETALLPAVRAAPRGTVLLADGFSCRTQLADLAGRSGLHLAQLLAGR